MKVKMIVLMSIIVLSMAAGCQKQDEEAVKTASPHKSALLPVAPHAGRMPHFAASPGGSDPHAGLKSQEIPPGTARRGRVVQTINTNTHTYIEVEDKDRKLWLAAMKTEVKKGDIIEFTDSPPMFNFTSKALKRSFDEILFVPGLRVVR